MMMMMLCSYAHAVLCTSDSRAPKSHQHMYVLLGIWQGQRGNNTMMHKTISLLLPGVQDPSNQCLFQYACCSVLIDW
jgi:hypothetical protein